MESRLFLTYFWPILAYLERFNQNGAFTVEEGCDDLSFATIKKKITEQFLRKLGLSGI